MIASASVEDGEENDDSRDCDRAVHGCTEHEVVLSPPEERSLLDQVTEDQANDNPGAIVRS